VADTRLQLRAARRALSEAEQDRAASELNKRLSREPRITQSQRIAAYFANDGEIDLSLFLSDCWKAEKSLYFPVIEGDMMHFAPYRSSDHLKKNTFDIPEPATDPDVYCPPADLQTVFFPLVGFDRHGNRLGRGKGYYDRTFGALADKDRRPTFIGVAHSLQEVEIDANTWDVRLDAIITERETIWIN